MKTVIGIPVWEGRVATTFDFAERMLVIATEAGRELERHETGVASEASVSEPLDVLLCGAISRPAWRRLTSAGIRVIPFVSGAIDEVLAAWFSGRLERPCFMQPGCRAGIRRRWRHGAGNRQRCKLGV